jgi:hypothetical protein
MYASQPAGVMRASTRRQSDESQHDVLVSGRMRSRNHNLIGSFGSARGGGAAVAASEKLTATLLQGPRTSSSLRCLCWWLADREASGPPFIVSVATANAYKSRCVLYSDGSGSSVVTSSEVLKSGTLATLGFEGGHCRPPSEFTAQ